MSSIVVWERGTRLAVGVLDHGWLALTTRPRRSTAPQRALTLEVLLQRITAHLPHHIRFIEEKRRAMA